jgi:hypothetical protein
MCNIDLLIFILIFIVAVLIAYKYYCYAIKTDTPGVYFGGAKFGGLKNLTVN